MIIRAHDGYGQLFVQVEPVDPMETAGHRLCIGKKVEAWLPSTETLDAFVDNKKLWWTIRSGRQSAGASSKCVT